MLFLFLFSMLDYVHLVIQIVFFHANVFFYFSFLLILIDTCMKKEIYLLLFVTDDLHVFRIIYPI